MVWGNEKLFTVFQSWGMYDRQCREVILRYWKKKGFKRPGRLDIFYRLLCSECWRVLLISLSEAGTFLSCIFVRCNFFVAYFSIFLDLSVFSDLQLWRAEAGLEQLFFALHSRPQEICSQRRYGQSSSCAKPHSQARLLTCYQFFCTLIIVYKNVFHFEFIRVSRCWFI